MNGLLAGEHWLFSAWLWALVAGALGMWLLLPHGGRARWQRAVGAVLGVVSVGLLASQMPVLSPWTDMAVFWLLAAITVASAAAMISMHSPVYSAIWFAMTLAGTAGLLLIEGAQLLAVATIAVYAGAIVVTFLFLIMLAQPRGHEYYDRIGWGSPAALSSAVAGAAMVLMLTMATAGIGSQQEQVHDAPRQAAEPGGILTEHHVATLGGVLFSRHLLAVQAAGALLLVALVGAVAIVLHGHEQRQRAASTGPGEGPA